MSLLQSLLPASCGRRYLCVDWGMLPMAGLSSNHCRQLPSFSQVGVQMSATDPGETLLS